MRKNNTNTGNLKFWKGFIKYCKDKDFSFTKEKPSDSCVYPIYVAEKEFHFAFRHTADEVTLCIVINDDQTYERFLSKKSDLRKKLGQDVIWKKTKDGRGGEICMSVDADDNELYWAMLNAFVALHNAVANIGILWVVFPKPLKDSFYFGRDELDLIAIEFDVMVCLNGFEKTVEYFKTHNKVTLPLEVSTSFDYSLFEHSLSEEERKENEKTEEEFEAELERIYLEVNEKYNSGNNNENVVRTKQSFGKGGRKAMNGTTADIRKEYWKKLISEFADSCSFADLSGRTPTQKPTLSIASGGTNIEYNFGVNRSCAYVELLISKPGDEGVKENERIFRELNSQKEEIEKEFGGRLIWVDSSPKRRRIYTKLDGVDVAETKDWDKIAEYHMNIMPKFYNAIQKRLQRAF